METNNISSNESDDKNIIIDSETIIHSRTDVQV